MQCCIVKSGILLIIILYTFVFGNLFLNPGLYPGPGKRVCAENISRNFINVERNCTQMTFTFFKNDFLIFVEKNYE